MKELIRSFAGGEVTPQLYGRIDLVKYQTGAKLLQNMVALPQGAAESRGGFEFGAEANHSNGPSGPSGSQPVRLIPFVFAEDQAAVLEFSYAAMRVYIDNAQLLEAPKTVTGYTNAATGVFTSVAHGLTGTVYLGAGAPPELVGRQLFINSPSADTFQLVTMAGAFVDTSASSIFSVPFTVSQVYEIATPYVYDDLFDLTFAQNNDVLTLTRSNGDARELRRLGATNWTLTPAAFASTQTPPGAPTVTPTVASAGSPVPHVYGVTSLAADGVDESPLSATTSASNDLTLAGNFNTIVWTTTGAARYNVYKQIGGAFGFIGQTTSLTFVDNFIEPSQTISPPEANIELNDDAAREPRTSCYHEQRRWFANTTEKPQTVFATRIGLDNNLTSSTPTREDDAFEFKIAATKQNAIRHLVPLNDLWALTVGGEFRIFADGAPAITPTSISVKPRGDSGASRAQPVTTADSIVYVQYHGSRLREISYNRKALEAYTNDNLSIAAGHLFKGRTITQLAYSREPEQIVWAVRDDGVLLGMTHVPEQEVAGWHRHTTDGSIESVCVIPEGGRDAVYCAIKRSINGRTVRYVERMHSREFDTLSEAFFVDAGLVYDGAATSTISNLWHLEGKTVQVLADGAVQNPKTVTDGAITLDDPAEVVAVGLQYLVDLETLPPARSAQPAGGQATKANVSNVHLRIENSSQVLAGPSFTKLTRYRDRQVTDPLDSPPGLVSGLVEGLIQGLWKRDSTVCVRQDLPLPLTVVCLVIETNTGG